MLSWREREVAFMVFFFAIVGGWLQGRKGRDGVDVQIKVCCRINCQISWVQLGHKIKLGREHKIVEL